MTPTARNPQAEQMADESMVRNLALQIEAIWPQERALLARYALPSAPRILDVGCGTGEFTVRIAAHYPGADVTGIEILESSLAIARSRPVPPGVRVRFELDDAFHLPWRDGEFDLVVCRHVTQSVPSPERIMGEIARVVRPGGWVHLLSEDYGMLHMTPGRLDPDELWHNGIEYNRRIGTDARIGRRTWSILRELGLEELSANYVVVDTLRVPRATFAGIITAWRDGYVDVVAANSALSPAQVRAHFDEIIAGILDPAQYAVWFVPVVSGRRPAAPPAP